SGAPETTREFARHNLDVFDVDEVDAVIVNSAGCGSTVREYKEVLASDPRYAEKAESFSKKVKDISVFLQEIELRPMSKPLNQKVAYHDACHLSHGQGVRQEPRKLLASIPGVDVVDLRDPEICCGSAGLYNILQPDMAGRLLNNKVEA